MKQATCRICKSKYQKRSMGHVVCSPACAVEWAARQAKKKLAQAQKAERHEIKKRKEALQGRSYWIKRAQKAFNAFIRERDIEQPCICCGRFASDADLLTGSRWDAGHYRSIGSAPHLRFDELNVHKQLVVCNRYGAGRAVDYRIGLTKRIGVAAVESLEADQEPRKWSIEDLKEIESTYKAKLKELQREVA